MITFIAIYTHNFIKFLINMLSTKAYNNFLYNYTICIKKMLLYKILTGKYKYMENNTNENNIEQIEIKETITITKENNKKVLKQ